MDGYYLLKYIVVDIFIIKFFGFDKEKNWITEIKDLKELKATKKLNTIFDLVDLLSLYMKHSILYIGISGYSPSSFRSSFFQLIIKLAFFSYVYANLGLRVNICYI